MPHNFRLGIFSTSHQRTVSRQGEMSTESIFIGGAATGVQLSAALSLVGREPSYKRRASAATTAQVLQSRKTTRSDSPDRLWWVIAIPSFIIAGYVIFFIVGTPPGYPSVKARVLGSWLGVMHVTGSLVALSVGPFQFHVGLRRRRPAVHRWVGRVYVAGIFVGGFGGFTTSLNSISYPIGDYAFAVLAGAWIVTASLAMSAIWQGDVQGHRKWMIRNFAMMWAAVMLRWQLVLLISLGSHRRGLLPLQPSPLGSLISSLWWWMKRTRSKTTAVVSGLSQ